MFSKCMHLSERFKCDHDELNAETDLLTNNHNTSERTEGESSASIVRTLTTTVKRIQFKTASLEHFRFVLIKRSVIPVTSFKTHNCKI